MITTILWDNDGILVDSERLYFEATASVLRKAGIELTERDYVQLFLVEGRGAWHLVEALGTSPKEVERMRDARNALYGEWLMARAEPIEGVEAVLQALRGRYTMGVVSSSRKDHFDLMHARTGLTPYFDFVLTASDYPRVKPHPDPYLAGIARSGARPSECVAIEDSVRGLDAAIAAGIRCIVVPTGLTRECSFPRAYRRLDHVAELPRVLESWPAD